MARIYFRDVRPDSAGFGMWHAYEAAQVLEGPEYEDMTGEELIKAFLEQSREGGYEVTETDEIEGSISGRAFGKLYKITRDPMGDGPAYFLLEIDDDEQGTEEELEEWPVLVRRHNGQCEYGEWKPVGEAPSWVGELAADQAIEENVKSGRVEKGGSIWIWKEID
jgi:hypothetical protein